jgi:hypothetical protein
MAYSAGTSTTFNLDWSSAGKIDLTLYDIKYDIDIHFDANMTGATLPFAFLELGLNTVTSTSFTSQGIIATATTNWSNLVNNGIGGANEYNQTYFGRFYAGFSTQNNDQSANSNPQFRYKSILSGHLSLRLRTATQSGITENSGAGRLLTNHFNCDSFLQQNTGSNTWGIWVDGAGNDTAHHQQINGSALWDTSLGGAWTAGSSNSMSGGIYRFQIIMHAGATFTDTRARGGQVVYRIYRVKKII